MPVIQTSNRKQRPRLGKGAHRSVPGILCLVGVVIQSDEVETGLHLVTASSEHVIPAYALSSLRVTAAEMDVFVDRNDIIKTLLVINRPFRLTYCVERRRGRSHMACSRLCHWTGPSAPPAGKEEWMFVLSFLYTYRSIRGRWLVLDPHHTLVAGVSLNEALAEAASCV